MRCCQMREMLSWVLLMNKRSLSVRTAGKVAAQAMLDHFAISHIDCVEIDEMAPADMVIAAQDLADRIAAMLTKLIRSAETEHR